MSIEGPKLSPGKGGWPKSKRKQALRRYRLSAAAEYKRAKERRLFGTQGAASPVRRIDPATGEIIEVIKKKGSPASPGKRRNLEARYLAKDLALEREKEVAEAKERGEVIWGDTWPDDDDEAASEPRHWYVRVNRTCRGTSTGQ